MTKHLPKREDAPVLLVSCYELGQQPVALATAAGRLRASGQAVSALDLAVDRIDEAAVAAARLIAISAPMHTALRIGIAAARRAHPGGAADPHGARGPIPFSVSPQVKPTCPHNIQASTPRLCGPISRTRSLPAQSTRCEGEATEAWMMEGNG